MSLETSRTAPPPNLNGQRLLVANRGEIAVRILRTAKRLGLYTISVYTQVDATSPHVLLADEAIPLALNSSTDQPSGVSEEETDVASNARLYLSAPAILAACIASGATLVHPGYGFLSESSSFATLLSENGITLLGPRADVIATMGEKHKARALANEAGVPIVPGSAGLVHNIEEAIETAERIGWPVMLKATAGGGGMGLIVCANEQDIRGKWEQSMQRAKSLFHNDGLFIEKFFEESRHIEVQIFGDGQGNVIHMGERECSVQRRHQKIIEECPSPFLVDRQSFREEICASAVRLGKLVNYGSAGTVEFLVDDKTANYYFLEMNTRLQVEHGATEMVYPGLDIVEMMIYQGVNQRQGQTIAPFFLDQERYIRAADVHAIEVRVYCENPVEAFAPSPGVLQYVNFSKEEDIRIDTWVSTGMTVSPFYDPLIAKVIVMAATRSIAIEKLYNLLTTNTDNDRQDLTENKLIIQGSPNNVEFLCSILSSDVFKSGKATTEWVDSGGVNFRPCAFTVASPGIETLVQSLPTRNIGLGIPPSGPMDPLSFQAANLIVGNEASCEGLEVVVPPAAVRRNNALAFSAIFHASAIVAVTGAPAEVTVDGVQVAMWNRVSIKAGQKITVGGVIVESNEIKSAGGLRAYIAILGGLPGIPVYLGSKSTSMGSGGYQGRALRVGDLLHIVSFNDDDVPKSGPLPKGLIPQFPSEWTLYALPGPHDDTEFLTADGIDSFYSRQWKVSASSNRMGIRLEATEPMENGSVLGWARMNGGEGGSHPSNILDNGYARGTVNLNGDTPVILTTEGPSMGGYLCISTIASSDQWKLGQLRPGNLVKFVRVSQIDTIALRDYYDEWLDTILALSSGFNALPVDLFAFRPEGSYLSDPKLFVSPGSSPRPKVVFRQAGDAAILVEYGEMRLDFSDRARIHAFETALREKNIDGIQELAPCIRSTMIHYDPRKITQTELLNVLIDIEETLPDSLDDMVFTGRKLTFPIVLDDKWNREALLRYMKSSRDKAVYLPSNIDYLARNNGIEGGAQEALRLLVSSPWLVFGVGFYLACPFLVPVDPRCRLVGQKMNPSRTYTPRGAVGIAGLIAAIYPVDSPGGYQLFGRTLPAWHPWGKGKDFASDKPWLLNPFDQVIFEPVSEEDYIRIEKEFDTGRYYFKIEPVTFSMKEYSAFIQSISSEIDEFQRSQAQGVAAEEAREQELLREWLESKATNRPSQQDSTSSVVEETDNFVTASLSGSVWQIRVKPGDEILSAGQIVVVLEAMKTEINIPAGEENVGLKVVGYGSSIAEGRIVQAGERLVYFA